MRNTTQQAGAGGTQDQSRKGTPSISGRVNGRIWYECGEYDMLLANAPPAKIVGTLETVLAPQVERPSRYPKPPLLRKLKCNLRVEEMTAVIERAKNGSRSSCFHTAGPKNEADYFTVRADLISGTPTIQALISGFHRVFIVDTC